jgi:hypothetical protein
MRIAVIVALVATIGSIAALIATGATWAMLASAFGVGGFAIVARLAHTHAEPRAPWRIRKLGPLPADPGLKPQPDVTQDPFRTQG